MEDSSGVNANQLMEVPLGAFDLAVEHYLALLDQEVQGGSADALIELEALQAWQEERAALLKEAVDAAWED